MNDSKRMSLSPSVDIIKTIAGDMKLNPLSQAFASSLDSSDSLGRFRQRFVFPKVGELPHIDPNVCQDLSMDCLYFGGNSIGLQPTTLSSAMNAQISRWARLGVIGHKFGFPQWEHHDQETAVLVAKLVGASPNEVNVMQTLTTNLHLLLLTFYRPTPKRYKILCEAQVFPSDFYAFESQARHRGLDPKDVIICMELLKDEFCVRTEDILQIIKEKGDEIALVCFSGIHYFTGQLFDIPTITHAAQQKGCYVGWDLAHAIGNVELFLHDWNVDFAVWCHYKYVCGGPGAVAGAFIHSRHAETKPPTLYGWWSHQEETRFQMDGKMQMIPGVKGYQLSCPSVFATVGIQEGSKLLLDAGMPALRSKSKLLTAYLEFLLLHRFPKSQSAIDRDIWVVIITPMDPDQRGSQLSVRFSVGVEAMHALLLKRGIVCDIRHPDVMRFAPLSIYNSFNDVYKLVNMIAECFQISKQNQSHEKF